jgi:hypothetical protein
VALKSLPDSVANDAQALALFQREAQAASALNHPNICTIHDIGEENGRAFIAMEFLDGVTLKHSIGGRAMELDTLLAIGIEVVERETENRRSRRSRCNGIGTGQTRLGGSGSSSARSGCFGS